MPIIDHVACANCGCVCDDLRVTVAGERITAVEGACPSAEGWFLRQRTGEAAAEVDGQAVAWEEAAGRAADILGNASAPLIFGLGRTNTEGQRAAVRLAEVLGATIDTAGALGHGASMLARQDVGECSCTLGELTRRADLVIFWGADPLVSHPHHLDRFAVRGQSQWLPGGPADRSLVVVDVQPTATAEQADLFVQVAPHRDFEVLCSLALLVQGREPKTDPPAGVADERLRELARRMLSCRCGVIFHGDGLGRGLPDAPTVAALLRLVTALNARGRFYACRLTRASETSGADQLLTWQTGYPFAVNLARGYPRYNPGEFTAQHMLERGETDACLLVGSAGTRQLSPAALEQLHRVPFIVLDPPDEAFPQRPAVRITVAASGIHLAGTAFRHDGVPLQMRSLLPARHPSEADVLQEMTRRIP